MLTGSTQEHALFFLHGGGSNGKGVLLNTAAAILGDYATTAPAETFLASGFERHPTELAGLSGRRLVVANEVPQGRYWDEPKIKTLTGGDRIAARFMRQDFFEFTPQFKLLVVGNHKPRLRAVDEAIRRRMHLIPFNVKIPEGKRDKMLSEKLRDESGGILKWIIEGCLLWQRDGLNPPQTVRDATESYLSSEDGMATFLEDCCEQRPDYWEDRVKLFTNWKQWAKSTGLQHIGTANDLYEVLRGRGFEESKRKGVRGFCGLRSKPLTCPWP